MKAQYPALGVAVCNLHGIKTLLWNKLFTARESLKVLPGFRSARNLVLGTSAIGHNDDPALWYITAQTQLAERL